jgi:hypothetical protein
MLGACRVAAVAHSVGQWRGGWNPSLPLCLCLRPGLCIRLSSRLCICLCLPLSHCPCLGLSLWTLAALMVGVEGSLPWPTV